MPDNQSQSRASYGRRHEYIVIADLLRNGFDVYIPLVDDRQIDCIIRRGDDHYIDLQIKSRSRNGSFAALNIPRPRKNYFFVFYVELQDTRWIIPSLKLVEIVKPDRTGKYNIYLTTGSQRFAEYIDTNGRFDRLRGPKE